MSKKLSGTDAILMVLLAFVVEVIPAWVLSNTWGWFIVPLGAPAISVLHAYGIKTTWALFYSGNSKDIKSWPMYWERVFNGVVLSLVILGIGWLAHAFMVMT